MGKRAARLLLAPNPSRERLLSGMFWTESGRGLAELNAAFTAVIAAEPASRRLRAITHEVVLPSNCEALIELAQRTDKFTNEEAALVRRAQQLVAAAIAVDDFAAD